MAKVTRRHTRLSLSADQSIPDEVLTTLTFSQVDLDTRSIYISSSPGILRVPNSSYTHARLTANVAWVAAAGGDQWVTMIKNGVIDTGFERGQAAGIFDEPSMERQRINLSTPLLQVSSGDYFELQAWTNLGPDNVIDANNTYFEIELYAGSEDFVVPGGGGGLATGNFARFFPAGERRFTPNANEYRFFPTR